MAAEVQLACHPDTPSAAVRSIAARIARNAGLSLCFLIEGDLGRLRIPAPRPPRIAEGLWRHTCCEIFVARKGAPAYHEFNLSPSGEWAAYAFSGYRDGAAPLGSLAALDPGIKVRALGDTLELEASMRLQLAGTVVVNLSAVIEDTEGRLSYWALKHPPGKPDFHHRDAFALELDEVRH